MESVPLTVKYSDLKLEDALAKGLVKQERVRDCATGQVETIRTIKMNSETFGSAFKEVFKKNVAKARRDNMRLLGVADVKPDIKT